MKREGKKLWKNGVLYLLFNLSFQHNFLYRKHKNKFQIGNFENKDYSKTTKSFQFQAQVNKTIPEKNSRN